MQKQIKKNIEQRYIYSKLEKKRLVLKSISFNTKIDKKIRWKIQKKFNELPTKSSITRVKNICIITGRSRSVIRFLRISRIQLKKFISKGLLPGLAKYSW